MMPFFLFQKNFKSDGLLPVYQPKKRKNMPLQKKVVHLPPKTSIIYSLKIENYARNFE